MAQHIVVNPVTRIEGHAKIVLEVDAAGGVSSAHLQVLEIRGFEKLLQGMELFKMPQMTARLCGVCPAAHHLASVIAIESGLGLQVPADARLLRQLLYAGHVLHSHALSTFVLTGPDILLGLAADAQQRNLFSLLKLDPELCKKMLRIRSIGQRVVEIVGGRGVHPVTAIPGGMAARPDKEKLELMAGWGAETLTLLQEVTAVLTEKLAALDELRAVTEVPYHSLALSGPNGFDMLEGTWVVHGPDGSEERRFTSTDYAQNLVEHVMPGSYMKSVRLRAAPDERQFFVGPLARLNVNAAISTPKAAEALAAFRSPGAPRLAAVDYIGARLVEMLHFAERLQQIPGELGGGPLSVAAAPAEGRFVGGIEAPRGLLVHDYTTDKTGRLVGANFIVATQNNYHAIDHAVTGIARHLLPQQDEAQLMNGAEFALRCYDPCLACATHTAGRMPMVFEVRQSGRLLRSFQREDGQ